MKSTIHENQKNNTKRLSKLLIYSIAFLTLLASLTSCTTDEVAPVKKTDTTTAIDGDIIPPVIIIKP